MTSDDTYGTSVTFSETGRETEYEMAATHVHKMHIEQLNQIPSWS